jgi:hypothetical protein
LARKDKGGKGEMNHIDILTGADWLKVGGAALRALRLEAKLRSQLSVDCGPLLKNMKVGDRREQRLG